MTTYIKPPNNDYIIRRASTAADVIMRLIEDGLPVVKANIEDEVRAAMHDVLRPDYFLEVGDAQLFALPKPDTVLNRDKTQPLQLEAAGVSEMKLETREHPTTFPSVRVRPIDNDQQ